MNFLQYLKDKIKLIIFYIILMVFISSIMALSLSPDQVKVNIFYINLVGFFLISAYLIIEYFSEKAFYKELSDLIDDYHVEGYNIDLKPTNYQHKLYLELFKSQKRNYYNKVQSLHEDIKEQKDYILSWIHEVKLPISACRLIIDNSINKTSDYLMDKIEDEINSINNYVEQALYFSRIDTFSHDYLITEIDLRQVIKNCIKNMAKTFISKRTKFNIFADPQYVNSDVKWLTFIFNQIISNSLKYTDEFGLIDFRFEEDNNEKRLFIIDNGIGIPSEDITRVFEKGFTGSNGRRFAKSTGIGLYLSNQMAKKLGHILSIQSELGKYTQVTIHFPKASTYLNF
jgi:signal transduction histidine kinase